MGFLRPVDERAYVMRFVNFEFNASRGDVVEVTLPGRAANVLLLDPFNFRDFRSRRSYRYRGGFFRGSPVRLAVPQCGHWYVVVTDPHGGIVSASARLLSA